MLAALMRCYFNLTNGTEFICDDVGIEVSCLNHALAHARKAIEELRRDDPLSSCGWQGWQLEIVDHSGLTIESLPLDRSPDEPTFYH